MVQKKLYTYTFLNLVLLRILPLIDKVTYCQDIHLMLKKPLTFEIQK